MKNILVVDDDITFCMMLQSYLSKQGYQVFTTQKAEEGLRIIRSQSIDLVLSDYRMPDKNGIELLEDIKKTHPQVPVIIMTSYGDIRLAVRAMKLGAVDYITKPVNHEELRELILSVFHPPVPVASQDKRNTVSEQPEFIQGHNKHWQEIENHLQVVGPTQLSVILQGESGTGKEFVARRLHALSTRASQPFLAIDCGALSNEMAASELFGHVKGSFTGAMADKKGQFELANGGTLFLDEIGNLNYEIQVKLLRALQERKIKRIGGSYDIPVDVRLVAATNEELNKALQQGSFREDLYHRLNEFSIHLKPLRERPEDIPLFAQNFLSLANQELNKEVKGFDEEVIAKLSTYPWPGNLRELKNVVKRSVLLSKQEWITLDAIPTELLLSETVRKEEEQEEGTDLKVLSENLERKKILEALEKCKYNKSKAARVLNIDRKTLYNKISFYNLEF
ncbi:MAG: DNA-binding response regulator [Cytophagaceae bacterium]|nr:DNA-binding response regulator [Cytophagaceae bacterium]